MDQLRLIPKAGVHGNILHNGNMAKIVQTLTRASTEYREDVAQSLVRDLDAVLEKLNTTFQEELKQEIEAKAFFME